MKTHSRNTTTPSCVKVSTTGDLIARYRDAPVMFCGPDGQTRWWSKAASQLFGYNGQGLDGDRVWIAGAAYARSCERPNMGDVHVSGEELGRLAGLDTPQCVRKKRLDGEEICVMQNVTAIQTAESGELVVGYMVQFQDVTKLMSLMSPSIFLEDVVRETDSHSKDGRDSVQSSSEEVVEVQADKITERGEADGQDSLGLAASEGHASSEHEAEKCSQPNQTSASDRNVSFQPEAEQSSHPSQTSQYDITPQMSSLSLTSLPSPTELLTKIYQPISIKTGESHLKDLVRLLWHNLNVHTAFVGYCIPDTPTSSTTLDLISALTPPEGYQSLITGMKESNKKRKGKEKGKEVQRFKYIAHFDQTGYQSLGSPQSASPEFLALLYQQPVSIVDRSHQALMPPLDDHFAEGDVCCLCGLLDEDGSLVGALGIILPVDHFRERKMQLQGVMEGLLPRTSAEVARVAEVERLKADKLAAEMATKSKSQFLANMSHEIRTPVSAIIGLTDMILWDTTVLSEENKSRLELINSSGEHLLAVINGVLDLSKIGDQDVKFRLKENPLKLRKCLKEAVHLAALSPAAAKKKIIIIDKAKSQLISSTGTKGTIRSSVADIVKAGSQSGSLPICWNVDPSVPDWVVGDVTRLRQVVLNLLTNALKFTDEGSVMFTVTRVDSEFGLDPSKVQAQFEGHHQPLADRSSAKVPADTSSDEEEASKNAGKAIILFSVVDTGCGIPREKINRLFMPYSQIDNPNNLDSAVSTGLGLAISSRLVQMMGGQIWVESSQDVGSKFSFWVPFYISSPTAPGASSLFTSSLSSTSDSDGVMSDDARAGSSPTSSDTTPGVEKKVATAPGNSPVVGKPPVALKTPGSANHGGNKPMHSGGGASTKKSQRNVRDMSQSYPLKILVAEDNPINQQIALSLLKKMGYDADLAIDGIEVLEKVHDAETYDLILMDLSMPRMGGIDAMKALIKRYDEQSAAQSASEEKGETVRCSEVRRPIVIALTASGTREDFEKCREAGMHDWLNKPFKALDLQTKIAQHFSHLLPSSSSSLARAAEPSSTSFPSQPHSHSTSSDVHGSGTPTMKDRYQHQKHHHKTRGSRNHNHRKGGGRVG